MRTQLRMAARADGARGTVLFLAMLVLLVLSALGFVAVAATVNQMSRTGSYRVATIATNVASSGADGTLAVGAVNPAAFNQFVAVHNYQLGMADVSASFFNLGLGGSFGREIANVGTVGWSSQLSNPISSHRAPGYQMGEYCFRKYLVTTSGMFRNDVVNAVNPSGADAMIDLERNAQKRSMTSMYLGPVPCN